MNAVAPLSHDQFRHLVATAPAFVAAVADARASGSAVSTSLADFPAGDMFVVYCALLYAATKGVSATFSPAKVA
jgi:hypothetical protein